MLVRKPLFYDIYKAVKFLTKDEKEQEDVLVEWIYNFKTNPAFYSLIAMEKKEIVGVLTGVIRMNPEKKVIFNLSVLSAKNDKVKEQLCTKVVKDIDPDVAVYTGTENVFLQTIGFAPISVNMMWVNPKNTKKQDQDEVINDKTA